MSAYGEITVDEAFVDQKTLSWMATSAFVHFAIAVGLIVYKYEPQIQIPPVIEVEILKGSLSAHELSRMTAPSSKPVIEKEPEAVVPPPPAQTIKESVKDDSKIVAVTPVPKPKAAAKVKPAPAASLPKHAAAPPAASHTKKAAMVPIKTFAEPSEVVTPELSTSDFENSLASTKISDAPEIKDAEKDLDLEKNLAAVDEEDQKEKSKEKMFLAAQTDQALKENEQSVNELEQQAKAEAQAINKNAEDRRKNIAAAQAAADQQKALARQQAAAAAAAMQENIARGHALGVDAPVRNLKDLRQMPGNAKPQYSTEDRLAQRQGEVSLLAFISKEGLPVEFKLVKSTGHRSLDLTTLKSIKKWRFYPGQEGWVEIPFRWDLKGGPQEMPATLRRFSSNQ